MYLWHCKIVLGSERDLFTLLKTLNFKEFRMVTKSPKKKAAPKSAAKSAMKQNTAPNTASVIPFNPLESIAKTNFAPFNKTIPSFGGLETMETTMNSFKEQVEKMSGGATETAREGIESLTKSGATFTKGAEQMMKTLAEVIQESSQRNAECMKKMMACRTLNEFTEAQNKMAQQNFDDMMSTMTKMSEMTIKLCKEAMEPMNNQMTKAMNSAMSAAQKKNAA
jgi:phasin family protein